MSGLESACWAVERRAGEEPTEFGKHLDHEVGIFPADSQFAKADELGYGSSLLARAETRDGKRGDEVREQDGESESDPAADRARREQRARRDPEGFVCKCDFGRGDKVVALGCDWRCRLAV